MCPVKQGFLFIFSPTNMQGYLWIYPTLSAVSNLIEKNLQMKNKAKQNKNKTKNQKTK